MPLKTEVKTEWNGKEVMKDFDKAMFKSLFTGASIVEGQAAATVSGQSTDLGQLLQSITKQVSSTKAVIGTNDAKAPHIEFGTRPHAAPISALQGWADRHGIPVGAVWMSIKRKGTKAQPFLLPALLKNVKKIIAVFAKNNINLKWVHR